MVAGDTGRAYQVGAVLGSYRLLQQIGAGGMGRVFIAEHVRLGRRVALKVLRSEYSGNSEAVQRFFSEARAVNCINHENIIEVSDFIESATGPSFYIMELLTGVDLRTLEDREGVLPLRRALDIALQVCRGVGAAHDAGVIHRDLKPDNIFLIERGGHRDFVKLLDFGVAKLTNVELDQATPHKTSAGLVVGTPDYMSPEQAYGQSVDQRCDVYALGVILFEMVAGRRPFLARTAREVMVQHMTVEPPRPSQLNPDYGLPADLEDLILACLRKDPEDRPPSIKDVELQLVAILERAPRTSDTKARARAVAPHGRRRNWLAAAGVSLLVASGGVFAWSQGIRPTIPVAQADGLVRAWRRVKPATGAATDPTAIATTSAPVPEMPPALDPPQTAAPAAAPARGDRLTIEPMAQGKQPPTQEPAPGSRRKIVSEPSSDDSTTATRPVQPARAPAATRRKPAKLDRDSVINPFE
jgi:serine/threonine-protein kinase